MNKNETENLNLPFPIRTTTFETKLTISLPEDSIAVVEKSDPKDCFTFMVESGVRKIIQKKTKNFNEKVLLAGKLIRNASEFLDSPITNYFSHSSNFSEKRWTFRSSSEKAGIINQINQYIPTINGAKTLGETICLIIDELFTNALFNAPFGETDYALDRNLVVVLDREKAGQLMIAHDDKTLFIGCIDQFGTLDCTSLIQRTQINLNSSLGTTINMGPGGAGVGLIRAIEFSSDIFAIVERGKRTFVGCTLELFGSARGAKACPKNFFFENFKTEEEKPRVVTVARGPHILIRANQETGAPFTLDKVDVSESFEAVIDMRLVRDFSKRESTQITSLLERSPQLKKVHLEYVNNELLDAISPFLVSNKKLEVKSILCRLDCKSCNSSQIGLLRLQPSPSNVIELHDHCTKCGNPINRQLTLELPERVLA